MNIQKYKIVLPGAITSLSILCGLFAIFLALTNHEDGGYYIMSCWLIIFAAIIDGIDGKVARMTNSSSEFGIQYDSIADVIVFGVSATVVIFRQTYQELIDLNPAYYLIPILFLLCGAIRLARFNTTATTGSKKCFYGLPIPSAAGAIMSLFLLFHALEIDYHVAISEVLKIRITTLYTILVSVLMVSVIEYDTSNFFFFGKIKTHWFRSIINFFIVCFLFVNAGIAFFLIGIFYITYNIGRAILRFIRSKDESVPEVYLQ